MSDRQNIPELCVISGFRHFIQEIFVLPGLFIASRLVLVTGVSGQIIGQYSKN
jgi:hypothetical protein